MPKGSWIACAAAAVLAFFAALMHHLPPADAADAPAAELRQAATTGSISGDSNQLAVASATGFRVGDWIIVEIGNEAGHGQRGTRGVGGTWPANFYATETELLGDKKQQNRLFAWAEDSGYVYWWLDGKWYNIAPNRPNTFYTGSYYFGKAVPRSLQARITAINGNALTLDKSAAVSAIGANVYLDTGPIINNLVKKSTSLTLPKGTYATGGVIWVQNKSGFVLAGQGRDQTTIYSPKGVPSAMIEARGSPQTVIKNLTLQGNFRDQGFGLNWVGSSPAGSGQPVTETDTPQGAAYPRGIFFNVGSHHSTAQDARVIDVGQMAVGVAFADDIWARRVENIQNDVMRVYIQWQFLWTDTKGGGCEDCEVRSTYVIPGFNAFKSVGVQFIRPKGINAIMAMNGSGGWLIQDANLRFTANSLHPQGYVTPFHPIIEANTNIGVTPQVALGGTIRNATMVQKGYVSAKNDTLKGIVINENNPHIRVEHSAYYAPDYKAPTVANGAMGVNSTGLDTFIDGMVVVGKPQPGRQNIFIQRGGGKNCTAQVVYGCETTAARTKNEP